MSKAATKSKSRRATKAAKTNGKRKPEWFMEPLVDQPFARSYLVLTVRYRFADVPHHPLIIPQSWARCVDGEFNLSESDFCPRGMAIGRAANENIAQMEKHEKAIEKGPVEFDWSLVFKLGPIEDTSFVCVEHGIVADMHVSTTLSLIQPTDEEIARHWEFGDEAPVVALPGKAVSHV